MGLFFGVDRPTIESDSVTSNCGEQIVILLIVWRIVFQLCFLSSCPAISSKEIHVELSIHVAPSPFNLSRYLAKKVLLCIQIPIGYFKERGAPFA